MGFIFNMAIKKFHKHLGINYKDSIQNLKLNIRQQTLDQNVEGDLKEEMKEKEEKGGGEEEIEEEIHGPYNLDKEIRCHSLYFDFNSIIHTFNLRNGKYISEHNNKEFENAFLIIDMIVTAINPSKLVYISIGNSLNILYFIARGQPA